MAAVTMIVAMQHQIRNIDVQFIAAKFNPRKPTVEQCLEVLDHVCKVPRKRRWSFSGTPQARPATEDHPDRDSDGVNALWLSPEALSIALVDAATRFKYNGTAVKDILLSERYLKLVAGEGGNEAEESANFRVALQAKVDGLEEDNKRLEQNLKDVHRKLDMLLSKLGK